MIETNLFPYLSFPVRLVNKNEDNKICWFKDDHDADKYMLKNNLKAKDVTIIHLGDPPPVKETPPKKTTATKAKPKPATKAKPKTTVKPKAKTTTATKPKTTTTKPRAKAPTKPKTAPKKPTDK